MKRKSLKKHLPLLAKAIDPFYRAICTLISHTILILVGMFIGLGITSKECRGRVIYYGSETQSVTVAYGGPTIFRFNEEVKTISQASRFFISPANDQNPSYTTLAVNPRFTRGSSKVTFILANGAVVSTKILIVPKEIPEKTDSFYDFRPKETFVEKGKGQKGNNITELDLMKAMIREERVVGYKTRAILRKVKTGIKWVSAKLVRIYTGPKFNGYVFKIRNNSSKKNYVINLEKLSLGHPNGALLSQVDRKILSSRRKKKNTAFLRIVSKPTSVYYNVNIPLAPVRSN